MKRTTPPFRADHVGSLLRTGPLKDARAKREKNEISAEELKAIEDREISAIITKQEDIGLQAVTDGEFGVRSGTTIFSESFLASRPISVSVRSNFRDPIRSR